MKDFKKIVWWVWGRYRLDSFDRLAVVALVTNGIYLSWLAFHVHGFIGGVFFALESSVFLILVVFNFNHSNRSYQLLGGGYPMRSTVDVFIPTVNEPVSMLEKTVKAAVNIEYGRKKVYLLDDGGRPAVRKLAKKYTCIYLSRLVTPLSKYKAANLNYGLKHSSGNFILTIDADNVVKPSILHDLMGHFRQNKIAIVASRQVFKIEKNDFNHDHLFYNYMQSGKNSEGVAISCGSGVIYRRAALNEIGGFSEWNLVEDLHTTYIANSYGYRSVYVSQAYVQGHAPTDLGIIYKQRGTWAVDTLRMFFWQQPLLCKGLNFRQRLHYFEMGYGYLLSGLFLPAIYILNFYMLFTQTIILSGEWLYAPLRLAALLSILIFFGRFSQGQLTSRVWFSLFPVFAKAVVLALYYRKAKPVYRVTSKVDTGERSVQLVVPQILLLAVGYSALIYHLLHYGMTAVFWYNIFWIVLMNYWLWPVIKMSFIPKKPAPAS